MKLLLRKKILAERAHLNRAALGLVAVPWVVKSKEVISRQRTSTSARFIRCSAFTNYTMPNCRRAFHPASAARGKTRTKVKEKGGRQRISVSTNMRENIGDSHSGADEYLRQPLYLHKQKAGHTPGLS